MGLGTNRVPHDVQPASCPSPGCTNQLDPTQLLCPGHWTELPRKARRGILHAMHAIGFPQGWQHHERVQQAVQRALRATEHDQAMDTATAWRIAQHRKEAK